MFISANYKSRLKLNVGQRHVSILCITIYECAEKILVIHASLTQAPAAETHKSHDFASLISQTSGPNYR